jgi:hypothetical protein
MSIAPVIVDALMAAPERRKSRRRGCEIVQRQKMLCYNLAFMERRQAGKALTKDWDQQDNQLVV